ncbi:hypothetical protein [Hydrogenophaga sp.]|uniref:hypothetical protein n=1 Tax=Hydrogenophaga sp. TaxID=1904254 RepID=UPI0035B30BBF
MNDIKRNTIEKIDIFDVLLIIAKNFKLLLITPLVVAPIVYALLLLYPKTYQSTAVIDPQLSGAIGTEKDTGHSKEATAALIAGFITSGPVIDSVRKKLNLYPNKTQEQARNELRDQVKVTTGRTDKFVTVSTFAEYPEDAQKLATVLIEEAFAQVKPRGKALEEITARLNHETKLYENAISLQNQLAEQIQSGKYSPSTSSSYADLVKNNALQYESIQIIKTQLRGLGSENLIQPPNLPEIPIKPKKAAITAISAAGSLLIILLYLIGKKKWQYINKHHLYAEKINQLLM